MGRQRRARIVESAAERFATSGYHRTPMARIAADVGLTEGGLLYHFPSKKHLLLAVADHRITSTARWWDALDPQAPLTELFVLTSAEAADRSSPGHALFAQRYTQVIEHLAAAFGGCLARGELIPGTDCLGLARECIAISDGLQLQWVLSEGGLDLVGAIRASVDRLHAAVAASQRAMTGP